MAKHSFEYVKNIFDKYNYQLLEKEYINNRTPMRYICPIHPSKEVKVRLEHIQNGVGLCRYCANDSKRKLFQLSYTEVKLEFEKRGFELLEEEYVNCLTLMKYRCPNHPEKELKVSFNSFKNGKFGCAYCAGNVKYNYDDVYNAFKERGYELLEQEYKNNHSNMRYVCSSHPNKINSISFVRLLQGQRCPYCAGRGLPLFEEVISAFRNRGYKLLENNYVNSNTLMRFECPSHPDKETSIRYSNLLTGQGCNYCYFDRIKGEGSHYWRGGISDIRKFMRRAIKEWVKNTLIKHNFTCRLSGKVGGAIEVHHTISFHKLLDQVFREISLPIKSNVSDYSDSDLEIIRNKIIEIHNKLIGIPLQKSIHRLFHSIYGRKNNTASQFQEFTNRFVNGEFSHILKIGGQNY